MLFIFLHLCPMVLHLFLAKVFLMPGLYYFKLLLFVLQDTTFGTRLIIC